MGVLLILGTILLVALISLIAVFKKSFQYWKKRNIPYKQPSIPFGTMPNPFKTQKSPGDQTKDDYQHVKAAGHKHMGFYILSKPIYLPVDVELIKNILNKDFHHFVDRGIYHNEVNDPLSAHLFSIEGATWKNLRAKLTPTFTSGKMRMMFATLLQCADNLKLALDDILVSKDPVDIKDILGRYTTDVIGSCAFGLDCNSFENPNSDFRKFGKKVFVQPKSKLLKGLFTFISPKAARRLGMKITEVDVEEFFLRVIKETVEYREKNGVKRNDFLQLLIELKNDSHDFDDARQIIKGLTMEEIAAQAFLFFIAGFETSSTTMAFCLYELAINPDCQTKVREEINEVLDRHDGKLTYESMLELHYLRQVVDETLRKYPPVPVLHRICVEDYKIPNTNSILEKGTSTFIPVLGLHHDPDYFPDPEKFDPERFNPENKHKIVPFTYLPFGDGPRACIGIRFGVMQTNVGLVNILRNFTITLNDKTKSPLEMDPSSFIMSALGNIWLDVENV